MGRFERVWGPQGWSGAVVLMSSTTVAAGLGLAATGSVASMFGSASVVALLVGSAVTFGVFDGPLPTGGPVGLVPDGRTSALAEHVLDSLDGIEHRRVALGAPWPQLSVGPTGVVVVEVCGVEGPLSLDVHGIRRRDDLRSCTRCERALTVGDAARRGLARTAPNVPVRTIAVVAAGTEVTVADDAPTGVLLITVDDLADVLARGPVLPMSVVDASFAVLNRTAMASGRD